MYREFKPLAWITGVAMIVLVSLMSLAACNDTSGGTYYYPHDTSHGYYDTHHHYHYYPKYKSGHRVVVVKPKGGSFKRR